VTALRGKQLQRLELEGDHVIGIEVLLADQGERFRRVQAGPDGCLYLLTDSPDGRVLRLAPEPQP
jgi:glucose/arabinose dehydrogenase